MRSNRGIFWYSLGLTLLLLLPMVLTVAFFTDQYQKQQLLRQASAADSTLHIEPGAQGVYTLLLVVQQEEPAFVLARADGPQQTVTLCALPGSLRVSAPSGTTTLAECALSAGAGEGCMARAAVWAAFLRQDPALLAGLPDGLRSRSARLLTDLLAADLNALGETLAYLSARTALTIDYTTAAVAAARGGVQLTEEGMAAVCALLL